MDSYFFRLIGGYLMEEELTKLKEDLKLWKHADRVNMKALERAINVITDLVADEYSDAPCRIFDINNDASCVDHSAFGSNDWSHCFMCILGYLIQEAEKEVKKDETQG